MRRLEIIFLAIVLGLSYAQVVLAVDQTSSNYQSSGSSFTTVVKDVSSANYSMTAALDAIIGLAQSPNFQAVSGPALNSTSTAPVVPVCGNGVTESGEGCDNASNNGSCPKTCSSSCTVNSCGSTGGGGTGGDGGGGGGGSAGGPVGPTPGEPTITTGAEFSGRAYPLSSIIVLKDGQIAVQTIAGPDGKFKATLTGLQGGTYTFAIYAEDSKKQRSATFSFPILVTQGAVATITGIFISPTIGVDKDVIKRGENVAIFGQSAPDSDIVIQVNSEPVYVETDADENGVYLYAFNTGLIENGAHTTKSTAALEGTVSQQSVAVSFEVTASGEGKPKPKCSKADLNCDGRVNLVDFSIAAFWYKRSLSSVFLPIETERLNNDSKVNLIDFSIMAYYWTG